MQVVTSPGVNMLVKNVALRRASLMGRSQQSPGYTMASPLPELPHMSPSLEHLSPGTERNNSRVSKRRHRKLTSSIWREVVPIYRDRKLVEGRCNHCRQVFAASRNSGTSHITRHLKDKYQKVIHGFEVLDLMEMTPHGPGDRPLAEIKLNRVTVHTNPLAG